MMKKIDTDFIEKVESRIDKMSNAALEKNIAALTERQPFLYAFTEATQEIFEDEEEYIELAEYFLLLTDTVFREIGFSVETIQPQTIQKADEEYIQLIEKLAEGEDFEDKMIALFENHQQADFLLYIFDTVFDEDSDYDDHNLEMRTQLVLFAYFIVDLYSKESREL